MRDFLVVLVIVAPALIVAVHLHVRAPEVIDVVLFPALDIDLGPLHHCISAKVHICDLRCGAVLLLGVVVGIKIVVHHAGIGQHTGLGHELLSRGAGPAAIAERSAEVHLGRGKSAVLHIAGIADSGCRIAVVQIDVKTIEIFPELGLDRNALIGAGQIVAAFGYLDRDCGASAGVVDAVHCHLAGVLIDVADGSHARVVGGG